MYLFLKIGVQQIQTSHRIAVDPTVVVIFTQSYPKSRLMRPRFN